MTGQTQFGHVTFPRSRASEVPESRFVTAAEKALSVEFDHQHLTTAEERSSFVTYLLGDDKDMSSRERPFLWKTAYETSDDDDMNLAVRSASSCYISSC